MKKIIGTKERDLNEENDEDQEKRDSETTSFMIEELGSRCQEQGDQEVEAIDKKQDELKAKYLDLKKRPCAPSPELQLMLLKANDHLWDKIKTYERYGKDERILRTRAVKVLKEREDQVLELGKILREQNLTDQVLEFGRMIREQHRTSQVSLEKDTEASTKETKNYDDQGK